MKRIFFISAAFILFLTATAHPQNKIAMYIGGGASFPVMDKTFSGDYRTGFNIHTGLAFILDEMSSIKVDVQLDNFRLDESSGKFPETKLNIISFKFSTLLGSIRRNKVNFYGKLGVGIYLLSSPDISETNLGLTGGGGVSFGIDREKRLYGFTELSLDYNTGKSFAKGFIPFKAGIFLIL